MAIFNMKNEVEKLHCIIGIDFDESSINMSDASIMVVKISSITGRDRISFIGTIKIEFREWRIWRDPC